MRRQVRFPARQRAKFEAAVAAHAPARIEAAANAVSVSPLRDHQPTGGRTLRFEAGLFKVGHLLSAGLRRAQQIRAAHSRAKRLRVLETVALGEKRFAAVLQVDGTQFLVGGGAGNVALLAMLPAINMPDRATTVDLNTAGMGAGASWDDAPATGCSL